MVMDTRITDTLSQPCRMTSERAPMTSPDSWAINQSIAYTAPRVGSHKSVYSERSGKFQPGSFRANPCIIKTGLGTRTGVFAVSGKYGTTYRYRLTGDPIGVLNLGSSAYYDWGTWNVNLENLSYSKAKAKLKDAEIELGVMLGELKETLDMLNSPFRSLTDAMSGMYKHAWTKMNKSISFLDALTGAWLTYRYGILPLISDIQAIIDAYHLKFEQVQVMSRKKAGARTETVQVAAVAANLYGYFTGRVEWVKEVEIKSTSHIYYQKLLEAEALYRLRLFGFHPSQFPSIGWELVRLSFVVDWFFSVGTWLRALMPDTNVRLLGNCTSQKITVKIRSYCSQLNHPGGIDGRYEVLPNIVCWDSSMLERRIGSSVPVLPAYNPNPLNLKRTLDALSLIWGGITKPLRRIANGH